MLEKYSVLSANLKDQQFKTDRYKHSLLYVNLMVTINQKTL